MVPCGHLSGNTIWSGGGLLTPHKRTPNHSGGWIHSCDDELYLQSGLQGSGPTWWETSNPWNLSGKQRSQGQIQVKKTSKTIWIPLLQGQWPSREPNRRWRTWPTSSETISQCLNRERTGTEIQDLKNVIFVRYAEFINLSIRRTFFCIQWNII